MEASHGEHPVYGSDAFKTNHPSRRSRAAALFPKRPAGAPVRSEFGALIRYGVGNDSGGFTILRNGVRQIFRSVPLVMLAGIVYRCVPDPSRKRDDEECKRWPKQRVVGKTEVRVSSWSQIEPGVDRFAVAVASQQSTRTIRTDLRIPYRWQHSVGVIWARAGSPSRGTWRGRRSR
jgi:hypothetical protein